MIIVRFRARWLPGKTEHALALLADLIEPSRALDGVISFDVGRDINRPDHAIVIGAFTDPGGLDRYESLTEVSTFRRLLPNLTFRPPELQVFEAQRRRHHAQPRPHGRFAGGSE